MSSNPPTDLLRELGAFLKSGCNHASLLEYAKKFYEPSEQLIQEIKEFRKLWNVCESPGANEGNKLERVVWLAFACLKGVRSVMSFKNSAGQYDLLTTPCATTWKHLSTFLDLPETAMSTRNRIMVEAKARKSQVDQPQAWRLSALLSTSPVGKRAGLGIFVSMSGASGFPRPGKVQVSMKGARAVQQLTLAAIDVPIVVIEHRDLDQLMLPGGLPMLLRTKVMEATTQQGWTDGVTLLETTPKHLADLA